MRWHIVLILLLSFNFVFAYTVTTDRPRIWLTQEEVSGLQTRSTTSGQAQTEYDRIEAWADLHINDQISEIPPSGSYRWDSDRVDNNMAIHLFRNSMAYKVSGDVRYGRRVADLLTYLAQNTPGRYTSSSGTADAYGFIYPALGVAYDWCYDQLDYSGNRVLITSYYDSIVQSAIDQPTMRQGWNPGMDSLYEPSKTEEPWYPAFLAIAIYGEPGIDVAKTNTAIERFQYYVSDYCGRWDESGYEGGAAFGGTYVHEQLPWHRATFFELWESATDESFWTDRDTLYAPGANDGSENARYHQQYKLKALKPNGDLPRFGDGESPSIALTGWYQIESAYIAAKRYQDPVTQYLQEVAMVINPTYNRNSHSVDSMIHDFLYVLWYDPSLAPSIVGVSRANFFDGIDQVVMRSGFDFSNSQDVYLITGSHKKTDYVHWAGGDLGHFALARGRDDLLINAGNYYWYSDWSRFHDLQPWSHNTVWVNDQNFLLNTDHSGYNGYARDFEWDASRSPQSSQNDFASIGKFRAENDNYAYTQIDFSNAYADSTATRMNRNIVFVDDSWVVVYDLADKANPNHLAKVAWQTPNEPVASGSSADWSDVGGDHYDDLTDASGFSASNGESRLYYDLLSPASGVTMRQVGDVGGFTTDAQYDDHGGPTTSWRVEVFDTTSNANNHYLHVLQPVSAGSSKQNVNSLSSIDSNFIGAEIRAGTRAAVLFSRDGGSYSSASFSVSDSSGQIKVVVVGLLQGSYQVNSAGSYQVDSDGVLYFEADLGATNSFVVAQTGVEDMVPPLRSNGVPSGALAAGTTSTTLGLITNEVANCRYSATSQAYSSMSPMTSTDSTSHSVLVSGLIDNSSYTYYVRCQDGLGNINGDDFNIGFSVGVSGAVEICDNFADDDSDTFADCLDSDCSSHVSCVSSGGGSDVMALLHMDSDVSVVSDETGNGYNGVVSGASFSSGKFSGGFSFDGVGSFISFERALVMNTEGAVGVWFNSNSVSQNGYIFSHRNGASLNRIYMLISGGGDFSCGFGDLATAVSSDNNVAGDGSWHLGVISWDASGMDCYLDGVGLGSYSYGFGDFSGVTYLGRTANGYYYDGLIDEVVVFNRSLSASEVSEFYSSDVPFEVGGFHEADLDESGVVEMNELVAFVDRWLLGEVSIDGVVEVIGLWKQIS